MTWGGEFAFGDQWVAFRGRSADNSLHAHATVQLTLSAAEPAEIRDADGAATRGRALIVRPGVRHALQPIARLTLVHLEPQTAMARFVLSSTPSGDVAVLPAVVAALFDAEGPLPACVARLHERVGEATTPPLDPRLAAALRFLTKASGGGAVARAATASGLSVSRLRALAQDQLGAPLSTWLMWRRLQRAGQALAAGATLADAALAGDFADQAHFSRTLRRAFGITPRTAGGVVGSGQAKASRPARRATPR